jgi:hypothetical protein
MNVIEVLDAVDNKVNWKYSEFSKEVNNPFIYSSSLEDSMINSYVNKFPLVMWPQLRISKKRRLEIKSAGLILHKRLKSDSSDLKYTQIRKALDQIGGIFRDNLISEELTRLEYKAVYRRGIYLDALHECYPQELIDKLNITVGGGTVAISVNTDDLHLFSGWNDPFPEIMPIMTNWVSIGRRLLHYAKGKSTKDVWTFHTIKEEGGIRRYIQINLAGNNCEYINQLFPTIPISFDGKYEIISTYFAMWDYFWMTPKRVSIMYQELNLPKELIIIIEQYLI